MACTTCRLSVSMLIFLLGCVLIQLKTSLTPRASAASGLMTLLYTLYQPQPLIMCYLWPPKQNLYRLVLANNAASLLTLNIPSIGFTHLSRPSPNKRLHRDVVFILSCSPLFKEDLCCHHNYIITPWAQVANFYMF